MKDQRFIVLDSWRGLCALFVAVHNFSLWVGAPKNSFVLHSSLFVDFFFVLSGFVITHAYIERLTSTREAGTFVMRRLGRLWPLHVTVLATFVLLSLVKFAAVRLFHLSLDAHLFEQDSLRSVVTNFFLVQAIDPVSWLTWNAPSWSISIEFCTYLLFAAICLASLDRRRSALFMACIGFGAAGVLLAFSPTYLENSTNLAFFRCFYGFFVGHLVYRIWTTFPRLHRSGGILETVALALTMVFVSIVGNDTASMAAPLFFGFAIWIFAQERGGLSALFKTYPFVRLGTWSYSIYMVHLLIIHVLLRTTAFFANPRSSKVSDLQSNDFTTWMLVIGYLAAVVVLAATSYRWVEQPGRRSFNRLSAKLFTGAPAGSPQSSLIGLVSLRKKKNGPR